MNKELLVKGVWAVLGVIWIVFKVVATTAISIIVIFGIVYLVSPPERRRRLKDGWMKVALKIGHFNSNVALGIFYWVVITPYGIGMWLLADPMRIKPNQSWINRKTRDLTLADVRKQS